MRDKVRRDSELGRKACDFRYTEYYEKDCIERYKNKYDLERELKWRLKNFYRGCRLNRDDQSGPYSTGNILN